MTVPNRGRKKSESKSFGGEFQSSGHYIPVANINMSSITLQSSTHETNYFCGAAGSASQRRGRVQRVQGVQRSGRALLRGLRIAIQGT